MTASGRVALAAAEGASSEMTHRRPRQGRIGPASIHAEVHAITSPKARPLCPRSSSVVRVRSQTMQAQIGWIRFEPGPFTTAASFGASNVTTEPCTSQIGNPPECLWTCADVWMVAGEYPIQGPL